MLMVGAIKSFWMARPVGEPRGCREPYLGEDRTTGVQMMPDHEIESLVMDAHAKGYQLACHAIGDAAIEQLVSSLREGSRGLS